MWKFGMDRVYLPFYRNLMIKDKGKLRTCRAYAMQFILACALSPCTLHWC